MFLHRIALFKLPFLHCTAGGSSHNAETIGLHVARKGIEGLNVHGAGDFFPELNLGIGFLQVQPDSCQQHQNDHQDEQLAVLLFHKA